MPKFLVETVSMFRMRYVIEAENEHHACDEVVMDDGELKEFSQKHLDEIITSTRQLTDEEYFKLFNEDNDYLVSWTDEQKLRQVNVIDYTKI